jgi:hypothetical protein
MVPWLVNVLLIGVLVYLLLQRRKQRWPRIAAQGLAIEDAVSVLAALRTAGVDGAMASWSQGTLTRDESGDYLWTPGGSASAQRLGRLRVESVRLSGVWEGIWSLQLDWIVLRCTGEPAFDVAAGRDSLRRFPDLARFAEHAEPHR